MAMLLSHESSAFQETSLVLICLGRHVYVILYVEEILHQLIDGLSHYFLGFQPSFWCRISQPSTVSLLQIGSAQPTYVFFFACSWPASNWPGCVGVLKVTDQSLKHTLEFGIGIHHAGLPERDRKAQRRAAMQGSGVKVFFGCMFEVGRKHLCGVPHSC